MALTFKEAHKRTVCQNTLTQNLSAAGAVARIRHTRNALDRLEVAKKYVRLMTKNANDLGEKLNLLATRRMTRESYRGIMDRLFPVTKDATGEPIGQGRRNGILDDIIRLYESNDRNAFPETKGTAYNLLNAVIEYTDHARTSRLSDDKRDMGYTAGRARYESAIFGSGDTLKAKALDIIMEDTAGNPVHQVRTFTAPQATGGSLLDLIVAGQ